jgi:hypothetical protein
MAQVVMTGAMLLVLASCANKQPDLKSPCVGAENSPCDRRPVNDWWAKA